MCSLLLASEIIRGEERRWRGGGGLSNESLFPGNGQWSVLSFYMSLKDSTSNGRLSGIKQIPQMYFDDFYIISRVIIENLAVVPFFSQCAPKQMQKNSKCEILEPSERVRHITAGVLLYRRGYLPFGRSVSAATLLV